jgi:hypothetical protein
VQLEGINIIENPQIMSIAKQTAAGFSKEIGH